MYKISSRKYKEKGKNIPYLGPNTLYYCHYCSLPLIDTIFCPECNSKTKKVPLTPPYDVRPASKADILTLNSLFDETFGVKHFVTDGDILLLNHIGSEDQMDEIIWNGRILGNMRYNLEKRKWTLKLNPIGLVLIEKNIKKNWVMVSDSAKDYIIKGANVLIPGIIAADENIRKGDYLAVITEDKTVIAGGIAKIDEIDRKNLEKGTYAKNYQQIEERKVYNFKKRTWNEVVTANEAVLKALEQEAITFISAIKQKLGLPINVSFSGGKDSLAMLSLVKKAFPDEKFEIFFVDTGIEFPETVKYVKDIVDYLGLKDYLTIETVSSDVFWQAFEKFGPPGRDFRYCCKFAKLAPIQRLIFNKFDKGKCLSFVGQRRYESYMRSKTEIWTNQYITNQINVSPIQNWTALMIWLYIYWQKLPYLELYDKGYERIGCWVCPSSNMAQFEILKTSHAGLYEKLNEEIEKWKKKRNLPEIYSELGLWRFKEIPKKIFAAYEIEPILNISKTSDLMLSEIALEESTCKTQPLVILGSFTKSIALGQIEKCIGLIGSKEKITKKSTFIAVSDDEYSVFTYGDGSFKITFKDEKIKQDKEKIKHIVSNYIFAILRSIDCCKCELCVEQCQINALEITDGLVVNSELCVQCGNCYESCPIVTIVHREAREKIKHLVNQLS